ncbi:hypothetical protein [Haloferula sp. A504]|uniref:hypothetical protein n=1 Tax=Haloferula sp. A504 TaxID=3373601 RepID=UPI0031C41869|nr:hypothetical protein [Verrucomicrobiaceae bacterium E54]
MKPIRCLLLAVFALMTPGFGADLGKLQTSFMARYDEANSTRDEQLKQLEASYLGALERHLEKVKASGDLKVVVPVRDEIEAMKAAPDSLPSLKDGADDDLKAMRAKYATARDGVLRQHAGTLIELSDKMEVALRAEEKELTRAGKIDDALAVERMRETLAKDAGILAARERAVAEPSAALAGKPAEWELLLKQGMKVEKQGMHPVGTLSEVAKGGRGFWSRLLTGGDEEDADDVLVTPSPARVSFKPDRPAREIRGKVRRAFPEVTVTLRIKADGKEVFEKTLDWENDEARIDVEFAPAGEIEIEADGDGRRAAWIYWTDFESR